MKNYLKKGFVIIFSWCIASCAMRRSEPLKGPFIPITAEVARGQVLYDLHCNKCHPGGEGGLGPDINWNPAPAFVKKFQVRHGLGVMPSFKSNEISKDELKAIGKYLKALKHQPRD